jgi:hypothetical protein
MNGNTMQPLWNLKLVAASKDFPSRSLVLI